MPRKPRIDAAGLLYHVMSRGIEKRKIFEDDGDRGYFLKQLGEILSEENAKCYGWVLMPNHFHLVLLSGESGLAKIMRQLLTRYAVYFNSKYKRAGHLFQNRYKSIVCEKDEYLLELVSYVHLNPIRAGMVKGVRSLSGYVWSGHNALLGIDKRKWQSRNEVLSYFGISETESIRKYLEFMEERVRRKRDLGGGGLIRSMGGMSETLRALKSGDKQMYDERVLGGGAFVEQILKKKESNDEKKNVLGKNDLGLRDLIKKIVAVMGVDEKELKTNSKNEKITKARSLIAYIAQAHLGEKGVDVGSELNKTGASMSIAYRRGKKLIAEDEESKNICEQILRF